MSVRAKPNREGEAPAAPIIDTSDLPEGWTAVALGQITREISYGYTAKASDTNVGPKLLRITDIQDNAVNWDTVPFCEIDDHRVKSYQLSAGDLVFARTGATTGKSFLIKTCPKSVFASYLIRVRPSGSLLPEYVAAFFQTRDYWNQITENLSGSAQPNCNASKLASLVVPIAPLAEQRQIASKLEEVLGKVRQSQQRLARIPVLLKRFRQSVLAAACSGKLTTDWRGGDSISDEIPETWQSVTLDAVMQGKPQNGIYKPQSSYGSGTLIVRIDAFYDGAISPWDELKRLQLSSDEVAQYGLANGELLVNRVNSMKYLGKSALVRGLAQPCVFESNMMRVRLNLEKVDPEYAVLYLQSGQGIRELQKNAKHAVNQSSINQDDVRSIAFNLPPLSEQQEIVRRVEQLFAFADQIEFRFKKAQAQVDRLTQSVLAKAFRGELVPTEAELARRENRSYEPASELLARIQSERVTQVTAYPSLKIPKSQIQTLPRTTPDANS